MVVCTGLQSNGPQRLTSGGIVLVVGGTGGRIEVDGLGGLCYVTSHRGLAGQLSRVSLEQPRHHHPLEGQGRGDPAPVVLVVGEVTHTLLTHLCGKRTRCVG